MFNESTKLGKHCLINSIRGKEFYIYLHKVIRRLKAVNNEWYLTYQTEKKLCVFKPIIVFTSWYTIKLIKQSLNYAEQSSKVIE